MQLERAVCAYIGTIYVVHRDAWPLRVYKVLYPQDCSGFWARYPGPH